MSKDTNPELVVNMPKGTDSTSRSTSSCPSFRRECLQERRRLWEQALGCLEAFKLSWSLSGRFLTESCPDEANESDEDSFIHLRERFQQFEELWKEMDRLAANTPIDHCILCNRPVVRTEHWALRFHNGEERKVHSSCLENGRQVGSDLKTGRTCAICGKIRCSCEDQDQLSTTG